MKSELDKMEAVGHRTVTDASVMTFGCLTGDYAQMHFDLDFGHSSGMGGPIAHGLLSAAWSLGALTLYAPARVGVGDASAYVAGFRIKFGRMVHIGDRFSLRFSDADGQRVDGLDGLATLDTVFEVLNQNGEVTCGGALSLCRGEAGGAPALLASPEPMPVEPWNAADLTRVLYADEMLELGPRGVSVGRTVTEAEVVGFAGFTGELNPLYLNEEFARTGPFGARIAPPMFSFCLGFGDYLRDLLSVRMPSAGFAGHLGDSWRFFAPVHIGDTIRVRHKPVSFEPSKSRPGMGIVQFALQIENQRGAIVQEGRVAMMMTARGDD